MTIRLRTLHLSATVALLAVLVGCKRPEPPTPASTAPLPSSTSSPTTPVVPNAGSGGAASDRPQSVPMGAVEADKVPGGAGAKTGGAPEPTGGDASPGAPASGASR